MKTTVWTTAQLRRNDFLKEHLEKRNRVAPPKFSDVVDWFKQGLENGTTIKPRSREYRLPLCLLKIQTPPHPGNALTLSDLGHQTRSSKRLTLRRESRI